MGFTQNIFANTLITNLYSIDCTQNQIPESCPTHKRNNLDFIFIGSDVASQTRLKAGAYYNGMPVIPLNDNFAH